MVGASLLLRKLMQQALVTELRFCDDFFKNKSNISETMTNYICDFWMFPWNGVKRISSKNFFLEDLVHGNFSVYDCVLKVM